jgi:hypothetical protein
MLLDSLNYWAILVATLAGFAVGALWYGVIFSKAWAAAVAKPREQLGAPLPSMLTSLLGYLLISFMTAIVQFWVGVTSPGAGVTVAVMMWLGFSFPSFSPGIMYAGHSRRLLWLDGGHLLAAFVVIGAIIGAWKATPPVY